MSEPLSFFSAPLPKVMLFTAGLGTRLKPFTENHPKALALVNGKTLLERNITYLKSFGFTEFVLNVHHFADQIQDFLAKNNDFDVHIQMSDESQELLETGGALVKAKELLGDESFLAMNVDILTDMNLENLIQFHYQNQPLATLAVMDRESSRKLFFAENRQLCGWKNFKTQEERMMAADNLVEKAFSGIQILHPRIFDQMPTNGKFSIMETYLNCMENHKILGFDHSGDRWVDVGRPESVLVAEKLFVG